MILYFISMICNYVAPTALLKIDTNVTWVYTHAYIISPFQGFSGIYYHSI